MNEIKMTEEISAMSEELHSQVEELKAQVEELNAKLVNTEKDRDLYMSLYRTYSKKATVLSGVVNLFGDYTIGELVDKLS